MRVLFLTHRLPYSPDRGDRIRAFHMLRIMSARADVDLVSLVHDEPEAAHASDLRRICSSVTVASVSPMRSYPAALLSVLMRRPITHALLDSPEMKGALADVVRRRRPEVVLAYCSGMARFALAAPLRSIPLVLDMVDVDSQKWATLGAGSRSARGWLYRREARCLAQFEALAAAHARVTLVVNEREEAALRVLAPGADIRVVGNGVDISFFACPVPSADPVVVFCGVMNYQPNAEAGLWLIRSVWPRVRAAVPQARLTLVGSDPVPELVAHAARDESVTITGRVRDVRPYLWQAAVSVAPLFTARGVQNKVLEAVAAGLPSVVTPSVLEGLPAEVRPACLVASDPDAFAAAILHLLRQSPEERRTLSAAANVSRLSWEQRLSPLIAALELAKSAQPPR